MSVGGHVCIFILFLPVSRMIKIDLNKKNIELKDHECSVNGMGVKVGKGSPNATPYDLHQNV